MRIFRHEISKVRQDLKIWSTYHMYIKTKTKMSHSIEINPVWSSWQEYTKLQASVNDAQKKNATAT